MNFDKIDIVQGDDPPIFFRLQFAQGNAWEHAIRLDFPAGASALARIMPEILSLSLPAVEFFFRLPDNRRCFIGVRWSPECSHSAPADFVRSAVELCHGLRALSFVGGLAWMKSLGPPAWQPFLFFPDFLEVGIVDSWHHPPPQTIWLPRHGGAVTSDAFMLLPPYLQETDVNYVAVEAGYRLPLEHWFGMEVSREYPGKSKRHRIDRDRFNSVVRWMLA